MKLLLALLGLSLMHPCAVTAADTVVLLHGLGRTKLSMLRLAHVLERDGYRVLNLSYPSRTRPLEALATEWLPQQLAAANVSVTTTPAAVARSPEPRVHFVTHSMGGIIVRFWLRERGVPANLGRVVMLAPPNAGSEISDRLTNFAPFRWFTGVNGRRLGTGPDALPHTLGPWPGCDPHTAATGGELGVIAGTRSLNPLLGACLPKPNDGKVSVARTHLTGETDHVTVPFTHTWMAWRGETVSHVRQFLRMAKFAPTGQST